MRALLLLVIASCAVGAQPAAAGEGERRVRVLALGDSITRGFWPEEIAGPPWPELLAERLGPGYEVINGGCGGSTVRDWLPDVGGSGRWCHETGQMNANAFDTFATPNLPADIVTLMLGSNDADGFREPSPVPVHEYATALRRITRALAKGGARKIVLMPPPRFDWPEDFKKLLLGAYRKQVNEICTGGGALVCGPDVYLLLDPDADFPKGDLHPNRGGNEKLAEAVETVVRELTAP